MIDEQADDLATLKEQMIDKCKEVTFLENANTRKDSELSILKAQVAKKVTELASALAATNASSTNMITTTVNTSTASRKSTTNTEANVTPRGGKTTPRGSSGTPRGGSSTPQGGSSSRSQSSSSSLVWQQPSRDMPQVW